MQVRVDEWSVRCMYVCMGGGCGYGCGRVGVAANAHTFDFGGCVYGVVCTLVCTVMMSSDVRGLVLDHITTPRLCAGACGCVVCEVQSRGVYGCGRVPYCVVLFVQVLTHMIMMSSVVCLLALLLVVMMMMMMMVVVVVCGV